MLTSTRNATTLEFIIHLFIFSQDIQFTIKFKLNKNSFLDKNDFCCSLSMQDRPHVLTFYPISSQEHTEMK